MTDANGGRGSGSASVEGRRWTVTVSEHTDFDLVHLQKVSDTHSVQIELRDRDILVEPSSASKRALLRGQAAQAESRHHSSISDETTEEGEFES